MVDASDCSDMGSVGATHDPNLNTRWSGTEANFKTCCSRAEEFDAGSDFQQVQSRIESLVSELSDVESLTIMSPRSDSLHQLTPNHTPVDSVMLMNDVYADDEDQEQGTGELSESAACGVVNRHLKPIRTHSIMDETVTPACFTQEITSHTDTAMARSRSVTPAGKSSGNLHQSHQSHHHTSHPSSAKPARFGEYRRISPVTPEKHICSTPVSLGLDCESTPTEHTPHLLATNHSDIENGIGGEYSVPSTPDILLQSSRTFAGARDSKESCYGRSPRSMHASEKELSQDPAIQEQKELLYAIIRAMEAQLKGQESGYQPAGLTPSRMQETARWAAASDPHLSADGIPRPHSWAGQQAHAPASSSETLAKASSEGRTVVITGGQTYPVALGIAPAAWNAVAYTPAPYNSYQATMQPWGIHSGFNPTPAEAGKCPQIIDSRMQTKSPSCPQSAKNGNSSTHALQACKSFGSGRISVASAKGEGLTREISAEICVGTGSAGGESHVSKENNEDKKQKNVTAASLPKGQTAAISQVLTGKAESEEVEPPFVGCLGQFWGANRKVTTKKEMPRAPSITAPVIESQGGEGLGVRLGCW